MWVIGFVLFRLIYHIIISTVLSQVPNEQKKKKNTDKKSLLYPPDCCQIEEIGDNQKQATGSDVRLCSSCTDISFRSSSSGTPIALIVGLCVGGGVLLLLIIAGIVFYCWR